MNAHFHLAEFSPDPFGGDQKHFPWCRVAKYEIINSTDGPKTRTTVKLDFLNQHSALVAAAKFDIEPHVEPGSPKDIERRLEAAGLVTA